VKSLFQRVHQSAISSANKWTHNAQHWEKQRGKFNGFTPHCNKFQRPYFENSVTLFCIQVLFLKT